MSRPPDDKDEPILGAIACGDTTYFGVFVTTSRSCFLRLFTDEGRSASDARDAVARWRLFFPLTQRCWARHAVQICRKRPRAARSLCALFAGRGSRPRDGGRLEVHVEAPCRAAPTSGQEIIYEVHVGTFTDEGTFAAARGRLDYLADLGVTAIELMPLSSFAGSRGWGYDGVAHFAPFAGYGTPDDLRGFIDDAHERGLRVLLDVVYNHFGPAGNYLRQFSKSYFTSAVHNAWGEALDFRDEAMRRYVLDNALYWFTEFRIDGLRLDAIQTIVDPSPRHILAELGDQASKFAPPRVLIGEDDANDPRRISEMGLTGVWADDFHHALHVTLTGETDGYYCGYPRGAETLAKIIEQGWLYEGEISPSTGKPRGHRATGMDAAAFVYCLQNHDQIGNRAVGDRLTERVSPDAYRAASVLLLLLPMTPLLFMGQEWGATSPFLYFTDHEPDLGKLISLGRRDEFKSFRDFADPERRASIPDPQSWDTFARSRLRWEERDAGEHARVLDLYRRVIRMRKTDPVFRTGGRETIRAFAKGEVLIVEKVVGSEGRWIFVNLGNEAVPLDALPVDVSKSVPLLSSSERPSEPVLPPWSATVFARATG